MQPKKECVSRLKVNLCLLSGLSLVLVAAALPVLWPTYYQQFIAQELKMTPTSKTYQVWKDNPVPIYIEFFFFNWTNRDSLEQDGEMHIPMMQEIGPYRFNEKIERVNVTFHDNDTVTYQQAKWWYFDPEHSKGSLDDQIVTLNVVALTSVFTVRDWNFIMRSSLSTALGLTKQEIHVKRSVGELLFEGYSNPLITMARSMPNFSNIKIPFDKFAWFYQRNGTTFMDGVFNMNTGAGDIQKMGKLESWNYRSSTDFYSGECASVLGTTGQLFPPGQTRQNKVQMFSPDLCRSIAFEYDEDTQVHGIPGYKYVGGLSMLDNGTVFPENECYCNGECVPSGVVNVTSCRFGAPAFASFPHFYLADPYFSDQVRGMRPIKEKHQFYLTLEPTTGIPLDVAARFQINLLLQPFSNMRLYDNVPTLFFPMLWFQQRATLLPEMAQSLRLLLLLQYLGIVLSVVAALIGCVLIGYALVLGYKLNKTQTIRMDKTEDSMYYVASTDLFNDDKPSSKQYVVMKPNTRVMSNAKL